MIHLDTLRKKFSTVSELGAIRLLNGIGFSIFDAVFAIYMLSMLYKDSYVGYLSAGVAIVTIFANLYLIPMFERKKSSSLFFYSLVAYAIIFCLFAINRNIYVFVFLFVVIHIAKLILDESYDLLVRKESGKNSISRSEGLVYSIGNIGWLVGPLISGFIAERYSIPMSFLLSAVFIMMSLISFKLSGIHDTTHKIKHVDNKIIKNFKDFIKKKDLLKGFYVNAFNYFWWTMIYLFVPMYMVNNGVSLHYVGVFLFAVVIPAVLFEYKFSKVMVEKTYKRMLSYAFLIIALCSFIAFFELNVYFSLSFLIFATIGMAIIEPSTKSYFFMLVKSKKAQEKYLGPYQIAHFCGGLFAKVLFSSILLFLPMKFVFLSVCFVCLMSLVVVRTIKI